MGQFRDSKLFARLNAPQKPGYQSRYMEALAYAIFFLGQNLLWGFAGYIETFLTDIGIAAASAAAILIIPKLWDAVNDVLFGYIVDRHTFKNGQKFMPWVRIGTAAVGITVVAMFAIPESMAQPQKIAWFLITYILFDLFYTILDAPAFAVTTVMTGNIEERTGIIAGGKLWSMVGGVLSTVIIPVLRPKLGWFVACIVFVVVSIVLMLPMLFTVKERRPAEAKSEQDPTMKEMLRYLGKNNNLIVVLIAMLLLGVSSVEQKMAIYMGRICLGQEWAATLVAAGVAVSVITVSILVPILNKRWDKFHILCAGIAFSIAMDVLCFFVGYSNLVVAIIMIALKCAGLGFWQVIIYMLIADTVEYGNYKSGTRAAGITFALQAFVAKLKNALIGSIILFTLAMTGFVEGENAVQPAGVADGVWGLFNFLPAAGFVLALIILMLFYKLRDKDVATMADYNNGKISREEAEEKLAARYGAAGY